MGRREGETKAERAERKSRKAEKKARREEREFGAAAVENAFMAEGDEEAPADAPPAEEAPAEDAPAESTSKRAPLGSPDFVRQWEALRDANLAKQSKKEEERKAAKSDLKTSLETCLKIATKGLKMCGTSAATYLLEHMTADSEKLKIHIAQDEDYIEELRFKHNKLRDLLDTTRDFTPAQLQKDLLRNREIRQKCGQLVRGDAKEEVLVDPEELLELVKVRNSLRLWFGGANMAKGGNLKISDADEKELFASANSEIKVKPIKEEAGFKGLGGTG